jgi:hypothetical protein
VRHVTPVVANQSLTQIIGASSVKSTWIGLAVQHVNVGEAAHSVNLACRVVPRSNDRRERAARLRQGYGAAVFASRYAASEDWLASGLEMTMAGVIEAVVTYSLGLAFGAMA